MRPRRVCSWYPAHQPASTPIERWCEDPSSNSSTGRGTLPDVEAASPCQGPRISVHCHGTRPCYCFSTAFELTGAAFCTSFYFHFPTSICTDSGGRIGKDTGTAGAESTFFARNEIHTWPSIAGSFLGTFQSRSCASHGTLRECFQSMYFELGTGSGYTYPSSCGSAI